MRLLLAAFLVGAGPVSAAVTQPRSAPMEGPLPLLKMAARTPWQELVAKIAAHGTYTPGESRIPAYIGLSDVRGPKSGPHLADYATIFGYADADGVFHASYATLVSENWRVEAVSGNWEIDQWILRVEMDGTIYRADQYLLVKTRDHIVLEHKQSAPSAAALQAKWQTLLAHWRAYTP